MQRRHLMPFGAEIEPNGVRFRLWAPDAACVDLVLGEADVRAMNAVSGGWYEALVADSGPGSRYRFQIDGEYLVPDPASRFQPEGVAGPSEVVHAGAFVWTDSAWAGRPWEDAVVYELHVGAFTADGSFAAVEARLDDLAALGVTAVQLMPVAAFPGARNWGYDGVLPFAPAAAYGRPDDLKRLVQAAHARGLMVLLDVVYNHFGPNGNYLHRYAKRFFSDRHTTPWGQAINFDGPDSATVRDFFIHNALYWLTEYHLDGLRLDAVHTIADDSRHHVLHELAERVRAATPGRHVHLVLENDANAAALLARDALHRPRWYTAQWNDDVHHIMHLILTGEQGGYYRDYTDHPTTWLGRALTQGFAYQGEASAHRQGARRGALSGHLPATAFVSFLQNHDQIGNRALGERIDALAPAEAVRAALAVVLLAPSPPLLFMGEEWAATSPFLYFCDFPDAHLAAAVRRGRRAEFPELAATAKVPDPGAAATFTAARLDWSERGRSPHRERLDYVRDLLTVRRTVMVPRLHRLGGGGSFDVHGDAVLIARWPLSDGAGLRLVANLSGQPGRGSHGTRPPPGPSAEVIFATHAPGDGDLPPWSVSWHLMQGETQ